MAPAPQETDACYVLRLATCHRVRLMHAIFLEKINNLVV